MGFNTYIRDLRKESGLSLAGLANEIGVSITTIKNAEYGSTNKPNSKFLNALSIYLKKDIVTVYRDIIFYSYYVTTNYESKPFINLLSLYCSYRELEGCEMNFPKNLTSNNQYDHIFTYHYYLKNPSHNVMMFDANYFFCENNKYSNDISLIINKIFFQKEISLDTNKDVKSIEIVFDNSIEDEVKIFNSINISNNGVLKKKIIFVLFDKNKNSIINNKII